MKRKIRKLERKAADFAFAFGIVLCIVFLLPPFTSKAAETDKPVLPPHLVQSVSDADIYEGMLALGMLECPVLTDNDAAEAYEIVKECVVKVKMEKAYGSGIVWEMTPEWVVIATNKHVLEYWDAYNSYIHFPQGYYAEAEILGVSEEYDVGFLCVDAQEIGYDALQQLRYAARDMQVYERLKQGDEIFYVGAKEGDTEGFFLGSVGDLRRYIEEFGNDMIYGYGYARTGMSGGGTFDAKGNLVGMISGGTMWNETASVPLSHIEEAYEEFSLSLVDRMLN